MSRWRSVYLVARREILERGRSRAFLISLAITVFFLALGIATLAAYVKIGVEHADRAGERYVPAAAR